MRSISRTLMAAAAGLGLLATTMLSAPLADAATPSPAAPPSTSVPAATSSPRAVTPTPSPSSAPAPSPSTSAAPAPSAVPAAPNAGTGTTPGTTLQDPSLAVQNAARNHAMGSTVAANEPGSAAAAKSGQAQALVAGAPAGLPGLDVSGYQVLNASNWGTIAAQGARFAYVKATESTDYVSSQFSEQYNDSYNAGLYHGAYHFATPDTSTGAAQANWFLDHGGMGTADGRTMPPLLDIEYNPYGATCYGLSQQAMVSWIFDFSLTIQARTGRLPAIYSTTNWWTMCTGNSATFAANPLFIARYPSNIADGAGTLPAGWPAYTLWQYSDAGTFPGDQDVFNGTERDLQTFGLTSSMVRTVANSSVYLVSGGNKYPVTTMAMLVALAPLGQVAYVPQSYLDSFATQQPVGRVIRGPDGSIYFFDSGMKLPFVSCGLVADYGGSCTPSGYVQMTASQVATFVTGPNVTPLMTSSGGPTYYVSGATKHEVLDQYSLAQAGLSGGANSLSPNAVSYLPFSTPIVRDSVFVRQAGSSAAFLLAGGKASPVDPSAAGALVPLSTAGVLQPESIAKIPAGPTFTGAFMSSADSSISVLGTDGLHPWAAGVGGAAFGAVTVTPALLGAYATAPAIKAGSAIMSAAGGTVYLVMPTDIRPISSWSALLALSGSAAPTITVVPQAIVAGLPAGPVALVSGTLVRNVSSATVYLVNGVSSKIPFSTFDPPVEAGFTSFTYTTDDRLAAYPTSSQLLGFGIQCGSQKYVSAGGSLHSLDSTTAPLYPFSFTSLDSFACGDAPKGSAATAFIRTPDGSIYYLSGGQKHPITSMARFAQLANGQSWLDVVTAFGAAIPTGSPA
ncbi:lysozyme [Leifsonia sp. EB34]|uniref:lysozyme n=1 Tax=Leifsonia sp. EB34 TaxID=3156303 RepID=UPI0035123805